MQSLLINQLHRVARSLGATIRCMLQTRPSFPLPFMTTEEWGAARFDGFSSVLTDRGEEAFILWIMFGPRAQLVYCCCFGSVRDGACLLCNRHQ